MNQTEAHRIARHYLGDSLLRVEENLWSKHWNVFFGAGKVAIAPTVEEAARDAADQLRAQGWAPSHARLEWRTGAGKEHALVYRHEGLVLPLYRVFASSLPDDYGAESLTRGTSAYGSLAFVLAEIAADCAHRIPSLWLPPFPGDSQ